MPRSFPLCGIYEFWFPGLGKGKNLVFVFERKKRRNVYVVWEHNVFRCDGDVLTGGYPHAITMRAAARGQDRM